MTSGSLSELTFASLLAYTPHGEREAAVRSKQTALKFKDNRVVDAGSRGWLPVASYFAIRLAEVLSTSPFPRWFEGACLVPMPRSAPLKSGALWPAAALAEAMLASGLGVAVCPVLERAVAVRKSAYCLPGERPAPGEHTASLRVVAALPMGVKRAVIIDDIVTRGASLLGAARRLRASVDAAEILGFAAVRRVDDAEFVAMMAPCTGLIREEAGRVIRRP